MQVVHRNLLAGMLVAWITSCSLNDHGLGSIDASHVASGAGGHPQGSAGMSAAGAAGAAGAGITPDPVGTGGSLATAGTTGGAGQPMADASASDSSTGGAAGSAASGGGSGGGAGGTTGVAGSAGTAGSASGGAGGGASGTGGASGAGGAGGPDGSAGASTAGAAGQAASAGCSDGTREGFIDMETYPNIAACSGAWDVPGLASAASLAPQCDRHAGNDGEKPDGRGCSVADLCALGWSVCQTAHAVAVATANAGCNDAIATAGEIPSFFVSRQRSNGSTCDTTNTYPGTNNLYGCGNVGSIADKDCAPFTHMLRDSDCQNLYPWECADGPIGTSNDEYTVVTKQTSSRGGVLCCKN
ncbi:MAG TPA: hypothetical protein VMT47_19505 [Polyangia bacterium]|nr:hypothetical protein [Polyangia bacterium]